MAKGRAVEKWKDMVDIWPLLEDPLLIIKGQPSYLSVELVGSLE